MKQLLLLLIALVSITVYGQATKPRQKILIGYNFSPDYSFRTLKNSNGSFSGNLVIKNRNDIEVAKFGFTTGLNICIALSNAVGYETGIQYMNKGYQTKEMNLIYASPTSGLPVKAKTVYAYQYVGVPLKMNFSFGRRKVRFMTATGLMTNFLIDVKQNSHYEYADGKTTEVVKSIKPGYIKIDISPMISVGTNYRLSDKVYLLVEPTFRYGLLKTMDAPVIEKLWNAGLNIGLYYGIK